MWPINRGRFGQRGTNQRKIIGQGYKPHYSQNWGYFTLHPWPNRPRFFSIAKNRPHIFLLQKSATPQSTKICPVFLVLVSLVPHASASVTPLDHPPSGPLPPSPGLWWSLCVTSAPRVHVKGQQITSVRSLKRKRRVYTQWGAALFSTSNSVLKNFQHDKQKDVADFVNRGQFGQHRADQRKIIGQGCKPHSRLLGERSESRHGKIWK